jgi:hypothetical protein
MDSGAVGSLVADYPLQLFAPADSWIGKTVEYLCATHLQSGGFFQNMIHSGINAYLTLHLAQVKLRSGDAAGAWELMDAVVALASPTGQWPEAIHPHTTGGCMGDGQHIWAAAEWLMFVRNLFVREETDTLIIGSGVRPEWLRAGPIDFGATLTPHGSLSVGFAAAEAGVRVKIDASWRGPSPRLRIAVPVYRELAVGPGESAREFIVPAAP